MYVENSKLRFTDNDVGMSLHQLLYFLRPNVSFKTRREYRGHKGVGATFLAYGYPHFKVQTKQGSLSYAAILRQGRQWAEDTGGSIRKPTFEEDRFNVPELRDEDSGTSVEIVIGDHKDERPNLTWIGATTAEQWLTILRLKTPLRGVYLATPPFSPHLSETAGALVDAIAAWREVLRGHAKAVLSAAFSPDGARIVSGSADATMRLWETASGHEHLVIRGHDGQVRELLGILVGTGFERGVSRPTAAS